MKHNDLFDSESSLYPIATLTQGGKYETMALSHMLSLISYLDPIGQMCTRVRSTIGLARSTPFLYSCFFSVQLDPNLFQNSIFC